MFNRVIKIILGVLLVVPLLSCTPGGETVIQNGIPVTIGGVVVISANMSGASTNVSRDLLAGNVDGTLAVDNGTNPQMWVRVGGGWYSWNLTP